MKTLTASALVLGLSLSGAAFADDVGRDILYGTHNVRADMSEAPSSGFSAYAQDIEGDVLYGGGRVAPSAPVGYARIEDDRDQLTDLLYGRG